MSCCEITQWGDLPAIRLHHASGAQIVATLYGAHLVSWQTADGRERLFCSQRSSRDGTRAIRGGIPLIFPQFAARGTGTRHGFARVANWRLHHPDLAGDTAPASGKATLPDAPDDTAQLEFCLTQADLPARESASWPHRFELRFGVHLTAHALALDLAVINTGATAFEFAGALHSYWRVDDLAQTRIAGLAGLPYINHDLQVATHSPSDLPIDDKIDRIYQHITKPLVLRDGPNALCMTQGGFTNAVIWNPGAADAAALSDLEDEEYRHFVCVEPGQVEPITLLAAETWQGWQRIVTQTLT